jgi:hypothetical protein
VLRIEEQQMENLDMTALDERIISDALQILETIVCTVPPDEGVVMLSYEGPSHWDDELGCSVYDHEYFSPLGDALIKLHDVLGGKRPADGGDAITPEWLELIGFDDAGDGCCYWEDDRGRLLETGLHGEWFIYGGQLPEEAWPKNRFQLRRLCEALAIDLTHAT